MEQNDQIYVVLSLIAHLQEFQQLMKGHETKV